jgi:hypothetical protein
MDTQIGKLFRGVEKIMEFWIFNTPSYMQPKFVWAAYFHTLDHLKGKLSG